MKRLRQENEEDAHQPSNDELVEHRHRFAIVQELVTQGCDEWPDTFELALEVKSQTNYAYFGHNNFLVGLGMHERLNNPNGGTAMSKRPRVLQWGWISHSRFFQKLFRDAKRGIPHGKDECTFVGWHYWGDKRTVVPVPYYVIEVHDLTASNLNICLDWIERYHTTLHDAQADLDAVTAVVPSFTKRLHPDGDRSPLEERERVARKLTLAANMDQFGL